LDLSTTWVPVLLVLAAMPPAWLSLLAWQRRRVPGALPLAVTAVFVTAWCGLAAVENTTNTPAFKILLINLETICQSLLPVVWLLVVLEYTGHRPWQGRAQVWLFVIPVVTLALAVTSNLLATGGPLAAGAVPNPGTLVTASPWFTVQLIYSALLLTISLVLLARAWLRADPARRGALTMLLACLLFPLAWGFMTELKPENAAPVVLALCTLLLAVGLYSSRLFELSPLAQAALVASLPEAVAVIDLDGRVADFNPAAAQLFELTSRGQPAAQALAGWPNLAELLAAAPAAGPAAPAELVSGVGADRRVFELRLTPLADPYGRPLGQVLSLRDATERRRIEDELALRAATDELTGLADREHGFQALGDEVRRMRRYESTLSLLLLDLDHLKALNDQAGRAAGDAALRSVARAMQRLARQSDLPARSGEDEFMLILPHTNLLGAETVAGRLLAAASRSEAASGLSLSLGAAELAADDDEAGEQLVARAEQALRAAKAAGGGRVMVEEREKA